MRIATSLFRSLKRLTTSSILLGTTALTLMSPSHANFPLTGFKTSKPQQPHVIPSAPKLAVKSYLLISSDTGKTLAEFQPHKRLSPASLTKMMTLYVIFSALSNQQISLDDRVLVSTKAWHTKGSRMFIQAGKQVAVGQLIQGITVDSGNDACIAMAEHIAGSETAFVQVMNDQAKRLKLNDTHYENATGLPKKNHLTSAHDLAQLARAIQRDFPQYYHYFSEKWFTYNRIKQPNRNRLLWRDHSVDGMKTGHTKSAGYCLVASAKRQDMRLISVVLGAKSDQARANTSQQLLNYGFRFFEKHQLFKANQVLTKKRVWEGQYPTVALGTVAPLQVIVPTGEYEQLRATLSLDHQPLMAPIRSGETLGKVIVSNNQGKTIKTATLIALNGNPRGSWWQRQRGRVIKFFHGK